MKAYFYILILFSAFVFSSCKHEIIPAPASNSPVFGIEGKFVEDSFALIAGESNVIMTPSVTTSEGIKIYKGVLGNSQSYFQLEIYNGNIDFPNQPKFDSESIQEIRYLPFNQNVLWSINKDDFPNSSSIVTIVWYVDGIEQVIADDLKIYKPGKYEVCAKVLFENQTQSTLCREVTVGFKKNADFVLSQEVLSGSSLSASVVSSIGTITKVNWFIDGNFVSNDFQLDTALVSNAKYLLRSEVTFQNGIVLNRSAIVDISWMGNGIADFSSFASETSDTWDYKTKITLLKDGKIYTSLNDYNADKFITIDKLEYHGTDASGSPVYLLSGNVDVTLTDSSNATFDLKGKIAVGFSVK